MVERGCNTCVPERYSHPYFWTTHAALGDGLSGLGLLFIRRDSNWNSGEEAATRVKGGFKDDSRMNPL